MLDLTMHRTPDGQFKLISVNLQGHEWLLTYNGAPMFGVIPRGNGGQPRFLHCQQTGGTASDVTLDCAAAYRCHFGPCTADRWSPVSAITLPKSVLSLSQNASSDGGSCVLTPNAPFDPPFPALSLGAIEYLIHRRQH